MLVSPAPGQQLDGLGRHRLEAGLVSHHALGLADHLAGHHHHVAVAHVVSGVDQERGQVVSCLDLADPGYGKHLEPGHGATRSIAARAMAAVATWSVISSGTARHRIPAPSTRATSAASEVSTSQPSSTPPRSRAP